MIRLSLTTRLGSPGGTWTDSVIGTSAASSARGGASSDSERGIVDDGTILKEYLLQIGPGIARRARLRRGP